MKEERRKHSEIGENMQFAINIPKFQRAPKLPSSEYKT
jgi:hypothetical protein